MQNKLRWKTVGILSAILAPLVFAQGDRGTITGVVRDSSGLPVPGAEVRIVNEATGIASNTVSSDSGNYTLPILSIGTYTITVQHAGFKTYVSNAVPVQVGQTTRVDIALEIGQLQEKVTVTADAPLISSDTSDVGTVINQKRFLDLPLTLGGDIRNASSFIFLSPGVSGNTWEKHIAGGGSSRVSRSRAAPTSSTATLSNSSGMKNSTHAASSAPGVYRLARTNSAERSGGRSAKTRCSSSHRSIVSGGGRATPQLSRPWR